MYYGKEKLKAVLKKNEHEETITQDTSQSNSDILTQKKISKHSQLMFDTDVLIARQPIYSTNHIYGYYYNRPYPLMNNVISFKSRKRVQSFIEGKTAETPNIRKDTCDDFSSKYKTEICKNFEFKGYCEWGNKVNL